jgi:hypothetical protein
MRSGSSSVVYPTLRESCGTRIVYLITDGVLAALTANMKYKVPKSLRPSCKYSMRSRQMHDLLELLAARTCVDDGSE